MPSNTNPTDRDEVMRSCERFLVGHGLRRPHEVLADLARSTDPELPSDRYGEGEPLAGFEREIAVLLGKEAAVFMPSGTMCQQIALRIWCERAGTNRVAFHPTCHLELHEQDAYRELHRLEASLVGPPDGLMTVADVDALEGVAALLVELPQREIGGQLPSWEELVALVERARTRGMRLHLDGARLWESGAAYGRAYSQIAGLFDTVYVSFYKGLGAVAGAALAGPADVVAEARVWQRRHGGNLVCLFPYVLSARLGLERRLPRMERYRHAARSVAEAIRDLPGVRITPDPPHTNMMHVTVARGAERFNAAALEVARDTKVWLVGALRPESTAESCVFELTVGDATLEIEPAEIAGLLGRVIGRA